MTNDVLIDVVHQHAPMQLLKQRRRKRQQSLRHSQHRGRHLLRGPAGSHQRLVQVQVHEPHLRVRNLADRLSVNPNHLRQCLSRKARGDRGGDVLEHAHDGLVEPLAYREANRRGNLIDNLSVESGAASGLPPRVGATASVQ